MFVCQRQSIVKSVVLDVLPARSELRKSDGITIGMAGTLLVYRVASNGVMASDFHVLSVVDGGRRTSWTHDGNGMQIP